MAVNNIKGYLFAAASAASYGTNPVFAKPCYADGMDTNTVLLFRYLFALLMLGMMMAYVAMRKGKSLAQTFHIGKRTLPQLVLLGVMMATSSITLFGSYHYMPVGIASTLLFVYPIMVAVIMTLCYGEKLSWLIVGCLFVATVGIALLCNNGGDGAEGLLNINLTGDFLIGFLFVMLSGLAYAIYIVGLNKSKRLSSVASMPVTFYVLAVGLAVFVATAFVKHTFILPHNPWIWLNLLALGFFPTVVSLVCTAKAIQCIGGTQTALLGALEPVTAVVFGMILFGETLGVSEVVGMIMIFASVTLVVLRNK